MFWLFLPLISSSLDVTYMSFSADTNPTNRQINMTASTSITDVSYAIEVWIRPVATTPDSGSFPILSITNDWTALYLKDEKAVQVLSQSTYQYCKIDSVSANVWTHLAFVFDVSSSRTFSCYKNSTLADKLVSAPTVSKCPDIVRIAGTFVGNYFDLRVWSGYAPSALEIKRNYTNYFTSPYNTNLKRYYRLIYETSASTFKEYITSATVSVSSFYFKNLWVKEAPGSLVLCQPGAYTLNSDCSNCPSSCSFCKGPSTSLCYSTSRNFVNLKKLADTTSLKFAYPSGIFTIEFWLYPFAWNTGLEVFSVGGLIKIKQRGIEQIVSFYDGNNNEAFNFTAPPEKWVHVAWVLQANNRADLYVNFTSVNVMWTSKTVDPFFFIGSNSSLRFNGYVADLRMWTSKRTASEITSNLYTNYTTKPADMPVYCPLNDTSTRIDCRASTFTLTTLPAIIDKQDCTVSPCNFWCPARYFFDSSTGECRTCDTSCLACNGSLADNCTVCPTNYFTIEGKSACYKSCPSDYVAQGTNCQLTCNSGYYNNSFSCSPCPSSCVSCTNSSYCTSCQAGYTLHAEKATDNCIADCGTGKFANPKDSYKCTNCDSSCSTCYLSSGNCTSCPTNIYIYNSTCSANCTGSRFAEKLNCYDCHESCETCNAAGSLCTKCNSDYIYTDITGVCYKKCPGYFNETSKKCLSACPVKTYPMSDNKCDFCHETCQECNGPFSNNCTKCPNKFYNNTCLAECPSSTYDNSSICVDCDKSCFTCSLSADNCTSCSGNLSYIFNFNCYAKCPETTYTLEQYKMCYKECPKGYFLNDSFCEICDKNCSTCEGKSVKCTSCPSDQVLYNDSCLYSCPAGFYPEDGKCQVCDSKCKTCTKKTFCESCSDPDLFTDVSLGLCNTTCNSTTYTLNKTCLGSCIRSYFPTENPKKCTSCPSGCLDCTSSSLCQTCRPNYYFIENACVSECPKTNYYADKTSMVCRRCDAQCLQCNGSSLANCTLCNGGKFVYINELGVGECRSYCPEGTYLLNGICKPCLSTCKACVSGESCSSCNKGLYFRYDKTCAESCLPGDLLNPMTSACTSYSSLSPKGAIDLASFSLIQITYPVSVTKGSGNLTIFSISNETFSFVKTYYISFGSTVSLGTSIATSISSSLFTYGTEYSIEFSANAVSSIFGSSTLIPRGVWRFYINPYKLEPLVVVINKGVKGLEVKKGDILVLDASSSYDPSADYIESFLELNWTCYDFSVPYSQYSRTGTSWADFISSVSLSDPTQTSCAFWDYINPPNKYVVTINQLSESDKVYRFNFTLSDQGSRSQTRDIFIRVVPSSFNQVSLENLPTYKVNTDKELQLFVKDPMTSSNSLYKWSCASSGKTPVYLTPSNSWVLSISSYSMSGSTEYTFSLTYSDINTKSSSVITIYTNSPPTSGTLSIDKVSGSALIDSFTVQMIGWNDEDLPLSYSFMMFTDYSQSGYFLTGIESNSVLAGIYAGGEIKVSGYCYDALGSRSNSNVSLTVTSLRDMQKILEELDSLSTSVDETNVFSTLMSLQAFARELNYSFSDADAVVEKKKDLFGIIGKCKSAADNLYARDKSEDSIYMYAALVAVAKDLILQPADDDLANSVLELVASINFTRLESNPIIYPVKNTSISVTSPQGLLRSEEVSEISQSLSTLIVLASSISGSINLKLVSSLVNSLATVFATGTVITERSKLISSSEFSYFTSKSLLGSLENTEIEVSTGNFVKIPAGISNLLNTTEVQLFVAVVNSNPFTDESLTVLNQYIRVELRDIETQSIYSVKNLDEPFLFTFNVSRKTLEQVRAEAVSKFSSSKLLPECSFWDESSQKWKFDGCSLSNIGEIYSYFDYQNIPNTFPIICSCNHLSQFSINFYSTQSISTTSYIIIDEDSESFSTKKWETSVVFFLLISGLITFIVTLSLAYYWDNYNPGLATPSIETEKTFRFWDPNRVETVLTELQKDFINQLSESRRGDKKDTVASVAQILNSGLVNKLMNRNKRDKKEDRDKELNRNKSKPHPVEMVVNADSDDEGIQTRTKKYLTENMNDPRFVPTLVKEPKGRQNSKKDMENTKAQLKLYLNHLEANATMKTPVDLFLEKYDDSEKLPSVLKAKLKLDKKELKVNDLQALGFHPEEFRALTVYKNGEIAADSVKLTGGKYCNLYLAEKIIDDAKRLHGSLKLPYWSLFWMFVQKEHKYLSLIFNLHIEFTKKQMLVLASVFWYQQLLFCQIYITYINWKWNKDYNQSGLCVWGCNYESQMLAGVICAILPWPIYYSCKYLFARNLIEENGEFAFK